MDNDAYLQKRLLDLANRAYQQNIYTYTNFLNIIELQQYHKMYRELSFIESDSFGGVESCERQVVQFGSESDLGYPGVYPIDLIKISPLIAKFSDDLTHRDYLGAVLNLGIDRNLIGDIVIKGHTGYLFCINHITQFILDNLIKIKHTNVSCQLTDVQLEDIAPKKEEIELIAASPRIDAVCASLTKLSRTQTVELFRTKKIFLNGICCENNSYSLKPDDVLVIRGTGKFIYQSEGAETRKGRVYVKLLKYI